MMGPNPLLCRESPPPSGLPKPPVVAGFVDAQRWSKYTFNLGRLVPIPFRGRELRRVGGCRKWDDIDLLVRAFH